MSHNIIESTPGSNRPHQFAQQHVSSEQLFEGPQGQSFRLAHQQCLELFAKGSNLTQMGGSAFCGISFGAKGTPIDLAAIILASRAYGNFTALVTDAFKEINGDTPQDIADARERFEQTLQKCISVFNPDAKILRTSEIFRDPTYSGILEECRALLDQPELREALLQSVPESRRDRENPLEYSLQEIAVSSYLQREKGIEVKLGPSREQLYDKVIAGGDIPLEFSYLIDALPVGTSRPTPVVHYSPYDRGEMGTNGQRIFFEDSLERVKEKLQTASPETVRYLMLVGNAAAAVRGGTTQEVPSLEAITKDIRRSRRLVTELICEHVYKPIRGAAQVASRLDVQPVPTTPPSREQSPTQRSTDKRAQVNIHAPKPAYAVEIFTGMRPTGNLTVANYVGAVKPLLQLARSGARPTIFVADMHALTTHEPAAVAKLTLSVVADYIALGLDPEKVDIYLQSAIQQETLEGTFMLMRHMSVAELLRVPTLKDKIRQGHSEATANALLACYPIMMAADILLQRARYVPVGVDQIPHIEVTRLLAERFNRHYGPVFPLPDSQVVDPVKILGLKGTGKMGKSIPEEAIFLADPEDVIRKKVRSAMTAFPGEMTEALKSNIALAKGLCHDAERMSAIDSLIEQHMAGEKVMGHFKALLAEIIVDFVRGFQSRRALLEKQPEYLTGVLEAGNQRARAIARETLRLAREAQSKGAPEE